jgi:hypothetical protein
MALLLLIIMMTGCGVFDDQTEEDTVSETMVRAVQSEEEMETEEEAESSQDDDSTAEVVQVERSNTLGIESDIQLTDEQYEALEEAIGAFTERGWQVSFVMMDVESNTVVSYQKDLELYSASAIKGPYVLSLLENDTEVSIAVWDAISYSDNDAYAFLREQYGNEIFIEWVEEAGVDKSQGEENYTTTTSLDLAKMWLCGYENLYTDDDQTTLLTELFAETLNSPISLTLGEKATVLSKCGWIDDGGYYNVYNDGGIVDDGDNPYILAMMSDAPGTDGEEEMCALAEALDNLHSQLTGNQQAAL